MPTLITNHRKKVVATRLKSTYSLLSQALQRAQADYGDMSGWTEADINGTTLDTDISDTQYVKIFADKYILPYLKTTSEPVRTTLRQKGYKNGIFDKGGTQYVTNSYYYYFGDLTNGATLLFTNNGNGTLNRIDAFLIWIDIDGPSGENKLGHDIFPFHFSPQKGLYVLTMEKSEDELYSECKNNNKESSCLALIIKKGWEMKDYPW